MPDPATLSLAAVGTLALTEGVKFLYAQAGELLKWWRDRRDAAAKSQQIAKAAPEVRVAPPQAITGGSFTADVNPAALERFENDLRGLRKELSEYADGGTEVIDGSDSEVLERVDALRRILEVVYGRPLTFLGEKRTDAGPTLNADVDIERVEGYVAGVRAREITSGTVNARVKADEVAGGGRVVGIQVGQVGGSKPSVTSPQQNR